MASGLFEVAVVVFAAAVLGLAARLLKQPIILAYLATGALIVQFNLFHLADRETFRILADFGIMFLLFLVGLEINYVSLRLVGRAAFILGISQIFFTALFGFLIGALFGFPPLSALYVAVALTFSSTIIVVKLLSEKRDLHSLYGKMCLGILLTQDAVVVLILIFLSGLTAGEPVNISGLLFTLVKGLAVFGAILALGRKFLPPVFDKIADSQELLFVASLAWVFLAAVIMKLVGFSIEIGGLLAGLALAESAESFHIGSRMRPLRDFFVLIFFVILGSSLVFAKLNGLILPALALSIFVLAGSPIIIMAIMGLLGYRKRTGFLTGISIAQVSEFSFILVALGARLGHLDEKFVALTTTVGVITIIGSTYIITHADKIFSRLAPFLTVFERKIILENDSVKSDGAKPIMLIGCHRIGQSIAFCLPKDDLLVVDFDPDVIRDLKRHGFDYIFGDIADPEIFERARIDEAKLVISTSPDLKNNLALLARLKKIGNRPKTIVRAEEEEESIILYRAGADYVLLPHFTSGQYLGKTIAIDPKMTILAKLKERDLNLIRRVRRDI